MAECKFFRRGSGKFDYYCELPNGETHDISYEKAMEICTEYAYLECRTFKENEPPRICYLTTLTCEILGLPDDNFFLNQLRKLRDNYMIKDYKLRAILKQYDVVGPIIAARILNEQNPEIEAMKMFKNKILPISYAIFEGKYKFALNEYLKMTNELIKKYKLEALNLTIPGEDRISLTENIPFLGHGRKIKR